MKDWLKFFGLSFFSDNIAKQALKRGYMNFVTGMIFALAFLFCGIIASDLLPFPTHYDNAADFKTFVRNAVADDALGIRIDSQKVAAAKRVDTFADDDAQYSLNGYNLVVDTRPAGAFDDFEAYYLSNDGKEQEISPEEYETLSDVAKRNFDFKVRYTSNELVLMDDDTLQHENYLKEAKNEKFAELQKKQGDLEREEYQKQVYNLYVKTLYPGISAYEPTGSAPLLRNYYHHTYVKGGAEKYLFIFDDSCVGSFKTDAGLTVTFYGFYKNFKDGATFTTDGAADGFIKNSFSATASLSVYVYFMNLVRLLPFIVLMPVVLALIAFCVLRLVKSDAGKTFGGSARIVGSYLFFGGLIAAILTFICGYFVPRNLLMIAASLTIFIVLLVRTSVFLITESVKVKRAAKAEALTENSVTENDI